MNSGNKDGNRGVDMHVGIEAYLAALVVSFYIDRT